MDLAFLCRWYTLGSKGPQSIEIAGGDRWFESCSLQRRVIQTRSIPTDLEGLASDWRSRPLVARVQP
jgi:hypothetical protein